MIILNDISFLTWSFILFGVFMVLLGGGVFFISDFVFKRDLLAEKIIIGFFAVYLCAAIASVSLVFAGIE